MARPGPSREPLSDGGGRRRPGVVQVPAAPDAPLGFDPGPPPNPSVEAEWETYWASPAARLITAEQVPLVRRYFQLLMHYRVAEEIALGDLGAAGRAMARGEEVPRPSAWHRLALTVETSLVRLENELGLSPRGRASLGWTIAEAAWAAQRVVASDRGPTVGELLGVDDDPEDPHSEDVARLLHERLGLRARLRSD